MTVALAQAPIDLGSGSGPQVVSLGTLTAGNRVLVAFLTNSASVTATVVATGCGTFVADEGSGALGGFSLWILSAAVTSSGASSLTVTVGAGVPVRGTAFEVSGLATSPVSGTARAINSGATGPAMSAGTMVPDNADGIAIACWGTPGGADPYTPGTGWTQTLMGTSVGTVGYRIVTSTATITGDCTMTGSTSWGATMQYYHSPLSAAPNSGFFTLMGRKR